MPSLDELAQALQRLDGRSYPAYKSVKGRWGTVADPIRLAIDHVQGDPYAAPSHVRARIQTPVPASITADAVSRIAAEDWLLRALAHPPQAGGGSGGSGKVSLVPIGPEVVQRSALRLNEDGEAEVRFRVGMPAKGRRIQGRGAATLLCEAVPDWLEVLASPIPGLEQAVATAKRQTQLREQLRDRGLVAFVAQGAVLPRASGVEQSPLPDAVPFQVPHGLEVTLDGPDGPVMGMGIPKGVTLIVGGGFHGKSTLLRGLMHGVWNHRIDDGREQVVADPDTVKVRAEDGRAVTQVDISAFLGPLPGGHDTQAFSTREASGSTSQAAHIVEAIEAGAQVLLIDEDTSATNLLIRDERIRALIPDDKEPIVPFVSRVQQLYQDLGISTIMVVGGSGDYLAVADTVIAMDAFVPRLATAEAKALAGPRFAPPGAFPQGSHRIPWLPAPRKDKVRARGTDRVQVGDSDVPLQAVEQVRDAPHAATVGRAIRSLRPYMGKVPLSGLLDDLEDELAEQGLDVLSELPAGDLVAVRRHEVAAALNRMRDLEVRR